MGGKTRKKEQTTTGGTAAHRRVSATRKSRAERALGPFARGPFAREKKEEEAIESLSRCGLEFIDVSDVTTLVSAANFAPRFNSVAEDDDFGKSASQGGATVSFPFFIGALAMLLLPSFD